MKEPKLIEQYADEERVYAWDFSKFPEQTPVDMVAAVMTIVTPATVPVLEVGTPVLDLTNKWVKAELKGGKEGEIYIVKCRLQTADGSYLDHFLKLGVIAPPPNTP